LEKRESNIKNTWADRFAARLGSDERLAFDGRLGVLLKFSRNKNVFNDELNVL